MSAFGTRRSLLRSLAAVVTAALAVSACGADTGSSGQAARAPVVSAPTTSSAPPASSSASVPPVSGSGSADSGSGPPISGSGAPSGSALSQAGGSQLLDAMTPVSDSGATNTGSAQVNGQYFADSVYLSMNPGPGNVSYNLERQWHRLQATVGLSDDSPENEKVRFQVIADQRVVYDHVFVLGQSQQISLDMSGVLRLELVATLASTWVGDTSAVWGNANLS
jgi:NPCBM/NEW2 domain